MAAPIDRLNHLADETSLYLRQHARNPVDWYPWGPEALQRAKTEDKPIFLSVGYSACHWCHVMEHESFENEEIAELLNQHFVSIKVDREERPDVDQIYMTTVQIIAGQGGWPMSVFLTPALKPFFGGTYFPPDNRYGRPGFKRILQEMIRVWKEERARVDETADQITEHLQSVTRAEASVEKEIPDDAVLKQAAAQLLQRFDSIHGGFGQPPKFLHTMDLRFLLRAWRRFELPEALQAVHFTLKKMAMGGIHDHLGGGFARYSTDAHWLAPHFEKMLYDNALLTVVYLEALQATGDPHFREVVEKTLGWVRREMTSAEGPFYSTLDADSEGEEGKFYVWTEEQIESILGKEDAVIFNTVYGVEPNGNWHDPHDTEPRAKNILHLRKPIAEAARILELSETELRDLLRVAEEKLFEVRSRRAWPGRDEKVITAWNGLMISAFAEAAQVLDEPEYAGVAVKAADFILTRMRGKDGKLFRTWSEGAEPKLNAYLEDYSFLVDGLISLYEATFEMRWLDAALDLTKVMIDQFHDAEHGGFYFTGRDHELLITRSKDTHDGALPSGNAVALTALLRMAKLTGRADLQELAESTLRTYAELLVKHPLAAGQTLNALSFYLGPVKEFAIVGDPADEEARKVLQIVRGRFLPDKVVALKRPEESDSLALLEGKSTVDGRVTTYVCENFACRAPVVGAEDLEKSL